MLKFAAKHFRTFIEIILWINLIGCAIAGWNVGDTIGVTYSYFGGRSGNGHPFIGAVVGLLVGMLTNIIYGGLLAIQKHTQNHTIGLC